MSDVKDRAAVILAGLLADPTTDSHKDSEAGQVEKAVRLAKAIDAALPEPKTSVTHHASAHGHDHKGK